MSQTHDLTKASAATLAELLAQGRARIAAAIAAFDAGETTDAVSELHAAATLARHAGLALAAVAESTREAM